MPNLQPLKNKDLPNLLLVSLMVLYIVYFSWYAINRYNTLNAYAADLSLIDQPLWNTVRGSGGFMEQTWGHRQQPRLAEHFEPILIPLALLFFGWDDVRILLIAQTVAIAVGAWPLFRIARSQFSPSTGHAPIASWAALAFVLAYLLFPQLQAANIADFHADPFVVTPLLFAFWYAGQRRWPWMWFWALIAMATKETLPTLTAMLGLYVMFDVYRSRSHPKTRNLKALIAEHQLSFLHGLGLILISTIWFLVATFLIVAPLARQYFGSDGPIYFANRYADGLAALPALFRDPARWHYCLGLFAAVGFLPLLAPELLILGLPVLMANLASDFPGQYSGEQHYSAPLAVAFLLAAIYGTRRLMDKMPHREINGQSLQTAVLIAASLWLLTWSLGYHARHGWTPLSSRTETYRMSPAAAQLPSFIAEIPPDAAITASAAVHPHLAHRRVAYVFPTVEDATYLLVDVTDIPGIHPNDARAKILDMLNTDWQLVKAGYGLILAQKTRPPVKTGPVQLPDEFYNFVRAVNGPSHPVWLAFGDTRLWLLGYDVHDDPDDGVIFRFYWRAADKLPDGIRLWPLVYDDAGQLLTDPTQVPMITAVWYPPVRWQPDEVIVTETLPQLMPATFHLGIAVGPEKSFTDAALRYRIHAVQDPAQVTSPEMEQAPPPSIRLNVGHWAQLATFKRQGPFLDHLPAIPSLRPFTPVHVGLGSRIYLTGYWLEARTVRPGTKLPLVLRWMTDHPLDTDFTVFVHLLAPDGTLVAQCDAYPSWLTPTPTSQWLPDQPYFDRHTLTLPSALTAGLYTLQLGLYDIQTLERLPLANGQDTISLGQIRVE